MIGLVLIRIYSSFQDWQQAGLMKRKPDCEPSMDGLRHLSAVYQVGDQITHLDFGQRFEQPFGHQ